jgi:D-aminopeptidase
MLVALSADMEGISRLCDPRSILAFERSYWTEGRRLMTADVVAAAAGLLRAGADEVVVLDNHGSGNPNNVIADALPDRARLETWNVFDLAEQGVDALLQVGYHARAGVSAFVSHTYVPSLRLRVNGECISESHGRAWAAAVPVLGITGNDAHLRTLSGLPDIPYLVVQHTTSMEEVASVFPDDASASDAIAAFAARVLEEGGVEIASPSGLTFEAVLEADVDTSAMTAAGWESADGAVFSIELSDWGSAREPLAAAMAAAIGPWVPYFGSFDLSSEEALERVHDEPILERGRERFAEWLRVGVPEWT